MLPAPMAQPHLVAATADTPEARLAALEFQRLADHQVLHSMSEAIKMLQMQAQQHDEAISGVTQMGVSLRQEVFAAKSELATGIAGANEAAQGAAMAQMAVNVEGKFAALDALTAQLTSGIQSLGARGHMVEQVIEQQVAGQAAGQVAGQGVITNAFMQLDAKLSRVAALAKSADGTEITARTHNVVPFTAAMSADIKAFKDEFAALPGHVTTDILRLLEPINAELTDMRVRHLSHDEGFQAVEGKLVALEIAVTEACSFQATLPGLARPCVVCTPVAPSLSRWSHPPPDVVSTTPGAASASGRDDPLGAMRAVIGGNNACHCIHVKELQERVDKLEAKAQWTPDAWASRAGAGAPAPGP